MSCGSGASCACSAAVCFEPCRHLDERAVHTRADSFDFSHDKIRDVAYAELSPIKQGYWHLRIAQALEEIFAADLDPVSAQLAAHYEQAGETVRAIPFYQRAAEVAQRVYAHEEAIGLLRHGLQLLRNLPDQARREEQQLNLLRLLSLALVATRGYGAPDGGHLVTGADAESTVEAARRLFSCGRSRSLVSISATSRKRLSLVISYFNWPTSRVIRFCWSRATTCSA